MCTYVCVCVSSLFSFCLSLSLVNMLKTFSHIIDYSHHSSLLVSLFFFFLHGVISSSSSSSPSSYIDFWLISFLFLLGVMLPECLPFLLLFCCQIPVVVGRVALVFSLIHNIKKKEYIEKRIQLIQTREYH